MNTSIEIRLVSSPLSFAEAPAGYPKKNNRKRAGTMGRGKRRESLAPNFLLLLFPLSIAPLSPTPPTPLPPARAFFFSLSSLLYDTKRPLRRREYLVAIYQFVGWMDRVKRLGLGWRLNSTPIFSLGTSLNWDGEHDTLAWNRNTNKSCFYQTRMTDVI